MQERYKLMEAHRHVIAHFDKMAELARQMETIPALVLEADYSYKSFGSWCLELKKAGQRYRLVFDGRDNSIALEFGRRIRDNVVTDWQPLNWRMFDWDASSPSVAEIIEMVRSVSPLQDSAV